MRRSPFRGEDIVPPGSVGIQAAQGRRGFPFRPPSMLHDQSDFHTVDATTGPTSMQIGDFREREHNALPGINSGSLRKRSLREAQHRPNESCTVGSGVFGSPSRPAVFRMASRSSSPEMHTRTASVPETNPSISAPLDAQSTLPVIRQEQIGQFDVGDPPVPDAAGRRNHLFPIGKDTVHRPVPPTTLPRREETPFRHTHTTPFPATLPATFFTSHPSSTLLSQNTPRRSSPRTRTPSFRTSSPG